MELDGLAALVTGASRGVGAATARLLAAAGCRVACAARTTSAAPRRLPGTLDETVAAITAAGGHAVAVPVNLSAPEAPVAMVERAVDALGGLDILVNNAAVTFGGDLGMDPSRYDLVMAINLRAPFLAMGAAIAHLSAGTGRILNVSSLAAAHPYAGMLAYGTSKAALEKLTVDAAEALRPRGIAVNCFRIDVAVASEGFLANSPGVDHSHWRPPAVAAAGMVWMLRQPSSYTGVVESMAELGEREQIADAEGRP